MIEEGSHRLLWERYGSKVVRCSVETATKWLLKYGVCPGGFMFQLGKVRGGRLQRGKCSRKYVSSKVV